MITAVTGANGHIGANLIRALLNEKRKVRAIINTNRQALKGLNVEYIKCDIRDKDSVFEAIKGADIVYHLAAVIPLSMNNIDNVKAINVQGTRNVVEACMQSGVRRMVYFSSIHALEQSPMDVPVNELNPLLDDECCPPYDLSKAAAEIEVRQGIENGLDAIILNPTAVIGPFDYGVSHMGTFLLGLAVGKMPALVTGGFNWVDVRDVTMGAIRAEKVASTGAKYLLSGHYASVVELAKIAESITGKAPPRLIVPHWMARTSLPIVTAFNKATGGRQIFTSVSLRAISNCNLNISHEKASRELSYYPRPLEQTISDTMAWFQKAGMLDPTLKLNTGKR